MIFDCQPIKKTWKPLIPGKCMDIGIIKMSTAVVNLIGDLSILFLTQNVIWNLMRVERRQRLRLSLVFMAGIVYVHLRAHSTSTLTSIQSLQPRIDVPLLQQ